MRRARRYPRALQIVFLLLLTVSTAQVVWWIYDQAFLAAREHDRLRALYDLEKELASQLLANRVPFNVISGRLPHLVLDDGELRIAPAALAALERERRVHIRRYLWEGSFFLTVLVSCMAVIWRTLREETRLLRRQENFIAAVSHEFKSPLASLQLSVDTISLRQPGPERLQELVERMRGDISRLESMVSKILDTASLESGHHHLAKEAVGLRHAVVAVTGELAERAAAAKVTTRVDVDADLVIDADPVAVRTVLRNLLENALRATGAKGSGSIVLGATARNGMVELAVADDGVGFEPAEASNLFEKFYRPGDELRRTGKGSGLGLYIVHRLMHHEQGWVAAHSAGPGRGATFTLAWPQLTTGAELDRRPARDGARSK
jgi:signal transduction histidine kinase